VSRVTLNYDNGSKIDFLKKSDALHHLKEQGVAGVVDLRDSNGKVVHTRKQLVSRVEKGSE
jgi:hypothetical protein